jgi:catechol-2,3-dioxygenase
MLTHAEVAATMPAVDIDRAKTFYTEILGLEVLESDENSLLLQTARKTKIYLYEREGTKAEHTAATFFVADLEGVVESLIERGVVFEQYDFGEMKTDSRGIIQTPAGAIAWLKDTEGNILGVASR